MAAAITVIRKLTQEDKWQPGRSLVFYQELTTETLHFWLLTFSHLKPSCANCNAILTQRVNGKWPKSPTSSTQNLFRNWKRSGILVGWKRMTQSRRIGYYSVGFWHLDWQNKINPAINNFYWERTIRWDRYEGLNGIVSSIWARVIEETERGDLRQKTFFFNLLFQFQHFSGPSVIFHSAEQKEWQMISVVLQWLKVKGDRSISEGSGPTITVCLVGQKK